MAGIHVATTVAALEQALEDRILNCELDAGAHLREAERAAEYDVARHSLRAACDRLVRRGLLAKRVNRGFFVPALTSGDAHEVFDLRRLYELPVVRQLAARREVPAAMLASLRAFDSLEDDAPWREVVRIDICSTALWSPRLATRASRARMESWHRPGREPESGGLRRPPLAREQNPCPVRGAADSGGRCKSSSVSWSVGLAKPSRLRVGR
jgi:Bacterial regulatory proteins, gntR family